MSMKRLISRLEEASGKGSGYDFDVLKHLVYVDEKARKAVIAAASSGDAERLADAVGELARLTDDTPENEDWFNPNDDAEDRAARDPSDRRAAMLYHASARALFSLEKNLKNGFENAAYGWNSDAKELVKSFAKHMGWD